MIFRGQPLRVLLDPGSQVAVFSTPVAKRLGITLFAHDIPIHMQAFDGETNEVAGKYYTEPLHLRHGDHWTTLPFELSRLEDQCDAILPHWWLQEHQPSNLYSADPSHISFDSLHCRRHCNLSACVAAFTAKSSADIPDRFRYLVPL
jgi:hypothetical protein